MPNPIFNALMGGMMNGMNPAQMLAQLKANPIQTLQQAGFNIPQGMNSPQQILNHLMQSGQINQGQIQKAQQMAQRFRF